MSTRKKKYAMYPIAPEFSEVGGFMARFVSDGYTVDAGTEILPDVLDAGGWKISLGSAQDLVESYLKACANRTATTGETVNLANIMTTMLSIRGSYEKRKSSAKRENVRVVVRLLEEMRPKIEFSMSNVIEGKVLQLQSVTSEGCEPGFVKQGVVATINGLNLAMLDGDTVTATMKGPDGEELTLACGFASLGSTRLDVTIPDAFNAAEYAGKKIEFEVKNRCGDVEQPLDSDSITATLLAGEAPPVPPTPEPTFTKVCGTGHEDDEEWTNKVASDGKLSIIGTGLTDDLVISILYGGEHEETFEVDEVTSTMITGTIVGGVGSGSEFSFTLEKPDGTVIGTATISDMPE